MSAANPYADLVDGRDLLELLAETARDLPALVAAWTPAQWAASYAPGKRSAARIVLHMLHIEIVDSSRLRLALADPHYVVQPFDPDVWMEAETLADGPAALAAWCALRAVNLELWRSVPADAWDRPFEHPEVGPMTLRDLAGVWSGHDLHHLEQLRRVRARED